MTGGSPVLLVHRRFLIHSFAILVAGLSVFGGGRQAALAGAISAATCSLMTSTGTIFSHSAPRMARIKASSPRCQAAPGPVTWPLGPMETFTSVLTSAVQRSNSTARRRLKSPASTFSLRILRRSLPGSPLTHRAISTPSIGKITDNGRIDEYNATTGAWEKEIASGLSTPRGLAYANGNLYVTVAGSPTTAASRASLSVEHTTAYSGSPRIISGQRD